MTDLKEKASPTGKSLYDQVKEQIEDWSFIEEGHENHLFREYIFHSYEECLAFMNACSGPVVKMDHHPDWRNTHNRLWVKWNSWDANKQISHKDVMMAKKMDEIYNMAFKN